MADQREKSHSTHSMEVENAQPHQGDKSNEVEEIFTPEQQTAILRKVDRRLIGATGVMYCISLMDRNNLGAAALAGMNRDLNLIAYRYSIIALVFFITYTLVQPVATILCRKIGVRRFLAGITLAWGILMICFGLPNSWGPLVAMRLILGLLEGGFFPGCVYLISTWYTRYELQKRYSVFYMIGCVAGACAGILAYGLMQMDGVANYAGWRWIFIMEGIITTLIGIVGYFALVDFPDRAAKTTWRFLSEDECAFILRRIQNDRDDGVAEPFNLRKWAASGLDLKVWGFAMLFFCISTIVYAIAYFLPIILRDNMGFSVGAAQCLVAPPYGFAAILMYSTSWVGDRYRIRAPIILFNALILITGLPLMGFASSSAVRYFGVFLTTGGVQANVPAVMAYQANNIRGQWKRAFCSSSLIVLGGIGGVTGSLIFRSQDAPQYIPGIWAAMGCTLLMIAVTGALTVYFIICNRKADRGEMIIEGLEGFRYTI